MEFERVLKQVIQKRMNDRKIILLIGPRQVGKTTLILELLDGREYLFLDGDDILVRNELKGANTQKIRTIIGTHKLVFIDEAQRIDEIGLTLKIIHDQLKDVKVIVSGSSSFELKNEVHEPLTGRKWEFNLFPISYQEFEERNGYLNSLATLEQLLIYGSYPDVLNNPGDEKAILNELAESYLFKDILAFGNIQKPEVLQKILRALAFQVGSEVSYNEIAQLVGVDKNTVNHYIHLLQLSYVIFPLTSFSRNLRNEIKSNQKIYFYDNGVRNALIQNFNPLELRDDKGALWENFLMSERLKLNQYNGISCGKYFWRTVSQQELDYLEEANGEINGYEFKWNSKAKLKIPKKFVETYQSKVEVITRENFRNFVLFPSLNQ